MAREKIAAGHRPVDLDARALTGEQDAAGGIAPKFLRQHDVVGAEVSANLDRHARSLKVRRVRRHPFRTPSAHTAMDETAAWRASASERSRQEKLAAFQLARHPSTGMRHSRESMPSSRYRHLPRANSPGFLSNGTLMTFLHDLPIADLIAHYGYLAIFAIVTLESAGLPLPGETVLLTARRLCRRHRQHQHRRRGSDRRRCRDPGRQCRLLGGPAMGPASPPAKGPSDRARSWPAQARPVPVPPAWRKDRFLWPLYRDAARLRGRARRREQTRCPPLHGLQRLRWCSLGLDHGFWCLPMRALDREHHGAGRAESARPRPHRRCGAVAVHAPARSTPHGRRRGRDPGSARRATGPGYIDASNQPRRELGFAGGSKQSGSKPSKSRWKRSSDSARPNRLRPIPRGRVSARHLALVVQAPSPSSHRSRRHVPGLVARRRDRRPIRALGQPHRHDRIRPSPIRSRGPSDLDRLASAAAAADVRHRSEASGSLEMPA